MELDDGKHQEREAVFPDEPALERALLDFALGLRIVAREDVSEIVEDHECDLELVHPGRSRFRFLVRLPALALPVRFN